MDQSRLGGAFRLLTSRGFKPAGRKGSKRAFLGELNCLRGKVPIQLEIEDWDFTTYPVITVIERPLFIPSQMAHLFGGRSFCYFAKGSAILDRFDPASAIAQCLDQATAVLNELTNDPEKNKAELQQEFLAYWISDQPTKIIPVVMGNIPQNTERANYYPLSNEKRSISVISDESTDLTLLARSWGLQTTGAAASTCWLLSTNIPPYVSMESRPRTIKETLSWLRAWDPALYNKFNEIIENETSHLAWKMITFAIKSPVGWIGFAFNIDDAAIQACKNSSRNKGKYKGRVYKQYLHGLGSYGEIKRLLIFDIGSSFIHSRNLEFPDLRDKHITLIGCGAIGGYLAQAITRLGAGSGTGSLTLIDPDTLSADNLGRHSLGYSDLFRSKSIALADELQRQFPFSSISGREEQVQPTRSLFSNDLVIDTTGEEPVSEMLNAYRIQAGKRSSPTLHVWIRGNGECVQALWTDYSGSGCYRCLRRSDIGRFYEERFPIGISAPRKGNIGCQAFTPYAVSAPMTAASLAADMIIDWIKGDPSPRFRTRTIESANIRKLKNQNIEPLKSCPACQQK